jgi:hypothetical protein
MKYLYILSISFFIVSAGFPQSEIKNPFQGGDLELNFLLDAGMFSKGGGFANQSHSSTYFYFSVLPGFFLTEGLSIEPEINLLAVQDVRPGISIIPNISYTYLIPNERTAIYIKAGYGISNSLAFLGIPMRYGDMNIGIFNTGFGIKYLISNSAALRIEINYKRSSYEEESLFYNLNGFYTTKSTETLENTKVLFGFSLLL